MNRSLTGLWRRVLRKFGRLGVLAGMVLLLALAIGVWIPYLNQHNSDLRAEAARIASTQAEVAPTRLVRQIPLGQQVGEFLERLPPLNQNPDDLRQVFRSATEHNIPLPKGEYTFKNEINTPLLTVTVSLPITADYASIKAFSAAVLDNVPNASLDELRMTREAASNKELESLVRFSFIYRKP